MQNAPFTAHANTPEGTLTFKMSHNLMKHTYHVSRLHVTLSAAFFDDPKNRDGEIFKGVQMPQLTNLVMLVEPNPTFSSELQLTYTEVQYPALRKMTLNGIGIKACSLAKLVHLELHNYPNRPPSMTFTAFLDLLNTGTNLTKLALCDYLVVAHHEQSCNQVLAPPNLEELYVYDTPGNIARFLAYIPRLPFRLTIGGEHRDCRSLECTDNPFLSMLPPNNLPQGQTVHQFLSSMASAHLELTEQGIRIDYSGPRAQCSLLILLSNLSDMSVREQFRYRALLVAAARAVLSNTYISALECSGELEGVDARAWLELFSGTPWLRELTLVNSGRAVSSFFQALGLEEVLQGQQGQQGQQRQQGAKFMGALMHYGGPRADGSKRIVCPRLEKVVLRGAAYSAPLIELLVRTLKLRPADRRLKVLELVLRAGRGGVPTYGMWQQMLLQCAENVMIVGTPSREDAAVDTAIVW